jgi:hypothetical protein
VFTANLLVKVAQLPKFYGEQVFNSIARKFGKRKVTLNVEPRTCERLHIFSILIRSKLRRKGYLWPMQLEKNIRVINVAPHIS